MPSLQVLMIAEDSVQPSTPMYFNSVSHRIQSLGDFLFVTRADDGGSDKDISLGTATEPSYLFPLSFCNANERRLAGIRSVFALSDHQASPSVGLKVDSTVGTYPVRRVGDAVVGRQQIASEYLEVVRRKTLKVIVGCRQSASAPPCLPR